MATKKLSEYVTELGTICHDEDNALNNTSIENNVKRAARVLSRQKPHVSVSDITGNGTSSMWAVSINATDWEDGFSTLQRCWCPFDKDDEDETTELDPSDFDVFEYQTGVWYFRLMDTTPSSSEVVRFQYTAYHTITDSASTIDSDADEDKVLWYAASLCFENMAAKAAGLKSPSLGSDLVDFQSRVQHYLNLAKEYREKSGIGITEPTKEKGASIWQDLDRRPPSGVWVTHKYKND